MRKKKRQEFELDILGKVEKQLAVRDMMEPSTFTLVPGCEIETTIADGTRYIPVIRSNRTIVWQGDPIMDLQLAFAAGGYFSIDNYVPTLATAEAQRRIDECLIRIVQDER